VSASKILICDARFAWGQSRHIEVLLLDGPMNPAAEGIDIAITAFPASFDNVADEFLWSHRRSLFASRQ
jgi:hypothetical protein